MAFTTMFGEKTLFAINDPKPLKGFPPGRVRIRQRNDDFVKAYVKTESGIEHFVVKEENGFWVPAFKISSNQ